jgi:putative transcriptional regulator
VTINQDSLVTEQPLEEPLNELLARYALGSLTPPLHALVAAHLSISKTNRFFVSSLEQAEGAILDGHNPIALRDRDERLAAIFGHDEKSAIRLMSSHLEKDPVLPDPLAAYLGCSLSDIRWRTLIPGIASEYKIEETERGEASLLWIKAGRKMPSHTHEGSEYTLVLKGAFSDKTGRYARGDIAVADAELDHKPIAEAGEDCICFAVTDAPLVLTNPIIKFFRRFHHGS